MSKNKFHEPVMVKEILKEISDLQGVFVDATIGFGGHARAILEANAALSSYYGFDQDAFAIEKSSIALQDYSHKLFIKQGNFREIKALLKACGLFKVDGLFLDLGVSSYQLDTAARGFSYRLDGPLDMRMDQSQSLDAKEIVNTYSAEALERLLVKNADVKLASLVAKAILAKRPFYRTAELVDLVRNVLPSKMVRHKHPAKTLFQALRIEVNEEYLALEAFLSQALDLLKVNGKLLIITFHSGEDKIVKNFFKKQIAKVYPDYLPISEEIKYRAKSYFVSAQEIKLNHRARSAKLRVLTKLKEI